MTNTKIEPKAESASRENMNAMWNARFSARVRRAEDKYQETSDQIEVGRVVAGDSENDFKAGYLAALRTDPAVVGLREALEELADIVEDRDARKQIDSFTSQPARIALGSFNAAVGDGGRDD